MSKHTKSRCQHNDFLNKVPFPLVIKDPKTHPSHPFSSVQSLSCVQLFATPWTAAPQASLSITNSQSPPKPMSIESVMPSNYIILCCPLLLLPSIFPSIRVFSNESALPIRWPKYWSFSFKISPSNECPGLISFRMDWLDLLAVPPFTPEHTWKRPPHLNGCSSSMLCNHAVTMFTQEFNHCLQILHHHHVWHKLAEEWNYYKFWTSGDRKVNRWTAK